MTIKIYNKVIPKKYYSDYEVISNLEGITKACISIDKLSISDILGNGFSIECNMHKENDNSKAFYKCTLIKHGIEILDIVKWSAFHSHGKGKLGISVYVFMGMCKVRNRQLGIKLFHGEKVIGTTFNNVIEEYDEILELPIDIIA